MILLLMHYYRYIIFSEFFSRKPNDPLGPPLPLYVLLTRSLIQSDLFRFVQMMVSSYIWNHMFQYVYFILFLFLKCSFGLNIFLVRVKLVNYSIRPWKINLFWLWSLKYKNSPLLVPTINGVSLSADVANGFLVGIHILTCGQSKCRCIIFLVW